MSPNHWQEYFFQRHLAASLNSLAPPPADAWTSLAVATDEETARTARTRPAAAARDLTARARASIYAGTTSASFASAETLGMKARAGRNATASLNARTGATSGDATSTVRL